MRCNVLLLNVFIGYFASHLDVYNVLALRGVFHQGSKAGVRSCGRARQRSRDGEEMGYLGEIRDSLQPLVGFTIRCAVEVANGSAIGSKLI